MNTYTLYWKDGKSEQVHGKDITEAIHNAGYGSGAIPALDFWSEVDKYVWDIGKRSWDMRKPINRPFKPCTNES